MGGYLLTDNAPLKGRNTLRVDARARLLAEIRDPTALPGLLAQPAVAAGDILVLGEGSNVLFAGDVDATVLAMATQGVEMFEDAERPRLRVAAGERWDDFVRWSLARGYPGLENLIMIPGTVGAAPIQNIGAYGVEVAEFVDMVEAWDTQAGAFVELSTADCAFGYRDSLFKRQPDRFIVTAVTFGLPRDRAPNLSYAGIGDELKKMGIAKPAPIHIAEAVVSLRTRKLPDPAVIGNAGSFFKNPWVPKAQAQALQTEHPQMPVWPASDTLAKLSAGWLIDACGLKGARDGDAGISNRHALVLVNHGIASGAELWAFAQKVQRSVGERFGVTLEPEPRVLGHTS
ncbi:UDP-N-acetylmuramate dehydrogenase [Oleiagrimonas sp. C23AA]|uniref:UDP-N-acetylmuramate dehydrogenase n=1 Tax=Oleiagrimonas sp. C23AA TaxID=2719047 RepID=UPI00142027B0|nr:UDP-N-acetylmuramate dehydrogenase [Oleiagrimonas sp. C23AA]NII09359.1 UDP-N-acetylmuramate dehydrogenase [Oleiagrimonas sp. C23AA]